MKKLYKFLLMILSFIFLLNINVFALNNQNTVKRIVAVVYDDSWSMFDNKEDYAYANYAVQNIIGFMNEDDELHVVKMSNKTAYETIDLKSQNSKSQNIVNTENWNEQADETPFEAVETACECLKDRKAMYGSSDNIEYWLLVLTDGGFEGMPIDVKAYLDGINDYMSDVKYESIWVFVGDASHRFVTLPNCLKEISNATSIETNNKDGICEALFNAIEKIYGRTSKKDTDIKGSGDTASFTYEYPINKVIIYEQDQEVKLNKLVASNGATFSPNETYLTNKVNQNGKLKLNSNIIEVMDSNNAISSGNIELIFDSDIDISKNKFQIIVEPAIALLLEVVDEDDHKIEKMDSFSSEDNAKFIARPINPYDNTLIDLSDNIRNIIAKYTINNIDYDMQYDSENNFFRFSNVIMKGSNSFNTTIELPGYFKVKSNIINIRPDTGPKYIEPKLNGDNVKVGNTISKEYEKAGDIFYELENLTNKENGTLTFTKIPKGIQIKVNGVTAKKNKVSVTFNEKNNVEIYRNRDYKETENSMISANIEFKDKNLKVKDKGVSFTIEPINRALTLKVEELFDDKNKLNTGNAYGKNLYKITPLIDGNNISKQELKESKIDFNNEQDKVKWKYKTTDENNQNVILVSIKRPLIAFGEKNVNTTFTFTTPFDEVKTTDFVFVINFNILDFILRLLIPILLLIWIIGLIKKPRFERKFHKFIIKKDGVSDYDGPISVDGGLGFLIPFKPETGRFSDLKLKAGNSKKQVIVDKKSLKDDMSYDGDDVSLSRDLLMYEDTDLIKKEGRSRISYTYHDVRNDIEDEVSTGSSHSGRRRRR